jgi:phospholipase D1/2
VRGHDIQSWKSKLQITADSHKHISPSHTISIPPKLLVDGASYFNELFDAISAAKHHIYIMGWWLTVEIPLLRGNDASSSLLQLFHKKASEGVKINVVLYQEFSMLLYNDNMTAKKLLESIHPNIQCLTHPHRIGSNAIFYWSHHQKVVLIDDHINFVGGTDICLGRYDHPSHPLQDPDGKLFPGRDYVNFCIRDFHNSNEVKQPLLSSSLIDRKTTSRLPWHDVSVRIDSRELSTDLTNHFTQLWNHAKTDLHKKQSQVKFMLLTSTGRKLKRAFVRRFSKIMQKAQSVGNFSNYADLEEPLTSIGDDEEENEEGRSVSQDSMSLVPEVSTKAESTSEVSVLKSRSWWSFGLPTETSIQESYIELISNAKRYVYIENQFFISSTGDNKRGSLVKNKIAKALVDRVLKETTEKSQFRVFVILPCCPAFEISDRAQLFHPDAFTVRATLHFISKTIQSIKAAVGDEKFHSHFTFHSLRKFEIDSNPELPLRQEQIYIHSKVMIVDDEAAIIGSANINDRSLLGVRDSEVCVLIQDPEFARSARIQLWQEHLQCEAIQDQDPPESEETWKLWKESSAKNTQVFDTLFNVWPSNSIKTLSQLVESQNSTGRRLEATAQLHSIQGRLVDYAVDFLENEPENYLISDRPISANLLGLQVLL